MSFSADAFIAIEAQRQALVQQYVTQRDERRAREKGNAMTSEELAAIKARAEAATPGPWEADEHGVVLIKCDHKKCRGGQRAYSDIPYAECPRDDCPSGYWPQGWRREIIRASDMEHP